MMSGTFERNEPWRHHFRDPSAICGVLTAAISLPNDGYRARTLSIEESLQAIPVRHSAAHSRAAKAIP